MPSVSVTGAQVQGTLSGLRSFTLTFTGTRAGNTITGSGSRGVNFGTTITQGDTSGDRSASFSNVTLSKQ